MSPRSRFNFFLGEAVVSIDEKEEEETNVGLANLGRPIMSNLDKIFFADGVLISTFLDPGPYKETLRGTSVLLEPWIYGLLDKHCPF